MQVELSWLILKLEQELANVQTQTIMLCKDIISQVHTCV